MNMSEYILLPREDRQGHIDLDTPCVLNGVATGGRARRGRKALLSLLGVENDVPNWTKAKIQMCHACNCHSENGYCENPLHISVGTVKENISDIPRKVRQEKGRRTAELEVGMYDPAVIEERVRRQRKSIEVTKVDTGETFAFESRGDAARALDLNPGQLSNVCNGKLKQTMGYTARYLR